MLPNVTIVLFCPTSTLPPAPLVSIIICCLGDNDNGEVDLTGDDADANNGDRAPLVGVIDSGAPPAVEAAAVVIAAYVISSRLD